MDNIIKYELKLPFLMKYVFKIVFGQQNEIQQ